MLKQPKILVATDFSLLSDYALRAGELIRRKTDGRLQLVHVLDTQEQWDWINNVKEIQTSTAGYDKSQLTVVRSWMENQLREAEASGTIEVLYGSPHQCLLNQAKKIGVDLVIMGHRGRKSYFRRGELAVKMIESSECPILIVNSPVRFDKVSGLVDTSVLEERVFRSTEELGGVFSSEINFLSVCPSENVSLSYLPVDDFHSKMDAKIKNDLISNTQETIKSCLDPHSSAGIRVEIESVNGIPSSLINILDETKTDIAVLTRHKKNRMDKHFLGPVTKGVLDYWRGNLLVTPPTEV